MFVGTYLFSLLLTPDFASSLPYLLLFGHYGIVWYFFAARQRDKLSASILRLVYCNVGMVLIYLFASRIVVDDFLRAHSHGLEDYFFAQVAFVAYDFLYGKLLSFYRAFLRGPLLDEYLLREGIRACRYGKAVQPGTRVKAGWRPAT